MPRTEIVTVYRAKGNSDVLAVVIPKEIHVALGIRRGDKLRATRDRTGRVILRRI